MKKILAFATLLALTLSLFTACGGSGNSVNDVILASQLLSAEDATAIMGQTVEVEDREQPYMPFTDMVNYDLKGFNLSVWLMQEALHDKDSDLENDLVKNGWESYMQAMERALAENKNDAITIFKAEGIQGASAYFQDGGAMGLWMLYIFYSEYRIAINLSNTSMSKEDTEEEIAWKQAKLVELGNCAVDNLAEIVG